MEGGQIQNAQKTSISPCLAIFRTRRLHLVCSHLHKKMEYPNLLHRILLWDERDPGSKVNTEMHKMAKTSGRVWAVETTYC